MAGQATTACAPRSSCRCTARSSPPRKIERVAADQRFVQVLVWEMQEIPLGRRQHWPIYRVAEQLDLPIGIHAGSSLPPSADQSRLAVVLPGRLRLLVHRFRRRAEQPDHRRRVRRIPPPEGRADGIRRHLAAGLDVARQQDLARRARRSAVAGKIPRRLRARPRPPDHPAVRRPAATPTSSSASSRRSAPTRCCCSRPTIRTGTSTAPTRCPTACRTTCCSKILVDNALETYPRLTRVTQRSHPMNVDRSRIARPGHQPTRRHLGFVDCDVHPYTKSPADLDQFLSERWRKHRQDDRRPLARAVLPTRRTIRGCRRSPACAWTPGRRTAAHPGSDLADDARATARPVQRLLRPDDAAARPRRRRTQRRVRRRDGDRGERLGSAGLVRSPSRA